MKRKLLAVMSTAVMSISMMFTALADTNEISNEAWWDAWTPAYEIKDGASIEFDIDVKGGAEVWSNVNAVFANVPTDGKTEPSADNYEGYQEYYVARGDNYGWGDASVTYDGGMASLDGNDAFIAMMADAHLDITITKTGDTIVYKYDATGANGTTATRTATITADTSAGLYVFFTGDTGVSMKVSTSETPALSGAGSSNNTAAEKDTTVGETTAKEEKTTAENKKENTEEKTTTKKDNTVKSTTKTQTSAKTDATENSGQTNPIVIVVIAVVAVVVVAGIIVATKKKD